MKTRDDEIQQYVKAYQSPEYKMGQNRRRAVERILFNLPRSSLLDVGTGRGETLDIARRLGHEPIGTEVVPELIKPGVVFAAAHDLPFADGAFDHVVCFDVLEHLVYEDLVPALKEMKRCAQKTVTVSASELPSIHNGRDLHISAQPAAEWERLIKRAWGDCTRIGCAGRSPCWTLVL